jgi:hypothetical protein
MAIKQFTHPRKQAMTITKTALAARILDVITVSTQAQQGPTRQIQVLPAPNQQVAKAPAIAEQAPARFEGQAPVAEAPGAEAAPAEDAAPQPAPRFAAPKFAPKVIVAEPKFAEPKFVEPKFAPVRKVSYCHGGYGGYGKRNCH